VLATVVGMAYLLLQSSATQRLASADFTLTILVIVVLGGVGLRWGAVVGGVVYTLLDQRLTALASSDAINSLPDILRVPLSEPMFLLGSLFILVVLFLPGGIAGVALRLSRREHRMKDARDVLEEVV
jgi:ABC-type branched-subunit amino acid transport system permease subunit